MEKYTKNRILRQIRKDYRILMGDARSSKGRVTELRKQEHLLRACCLTVLACSKELGQCGKDEGGRLVILDEAWDFCELSGYAITEENLEQYLFNVAQRQNLSYSEISCLIPIVMFCCVRAYCLGKIDHLCLVRSLRVLHDRDGGDLAEKLSKAEAVMMQDSVYPDLDRESKQLYRDRLRRLARKKGWDERKTAVEFLKKARKESSDGFGQIGHRFFPERNCPYYFPVLFVLCVIFLAGFYFAVRNVFLLLISLIPVFLSAKLLCDTLFSRLVPSHILPKIKITEENCPVTLLTVVSLIRNQSDAKRLLHRLDVLSHRVTLSSVRVGLLLDLPSGKEALSSSEGELITYLEGEISARNEKQDRFFCALRKRREVVGEYHYEAFGRKQGAMVDFADLTAGKSDAFLLCCGTVAGAVYMVTLDSDTEPTLGSVESLIGFLEHPNHKPTLTEDRHGFCYVSKGYAAAAPRIQANPETSFGTAYAQILAGNSGTELYRNPHFDLYQDLFSEGIFCGKGIVNLALYRQVIGRRFRNRPLLSHDHPEGQFMRCANLSDIVFFDEIPDNVLSDEKRNHRWIRGDFQNIPFLSRKENRSFIFSFQIFHNLTRALFPTACFILAVSSVFLGPRALFSALFWLCFPYLLRIPNLVYVMMQSHRFVDPLRQHRLALTELFLSILLLPTRAINALDAVCRAIVRLIRKKNLLEWTTAAGAAKSGKNVGDYFYGLKFQQLGFPLLFFPQTILLGAIWMLSPVIAHRISRKIPRDNSSVDALRDDLGCMWQYYADLMNEQNNYLPPDNYQQDPLNTVAQRTSPTNIGFGLLSVLGAYDLDLIDEAELFTRVEQSLNTIEALPKWKGHLYNWYDIRSLKVLSPKFVSSVDCGNWAAALYTLQKGMGEFSSQRANAISSRIEALLQAADLGLLYDKKKHLFSIGYNAQEGEMSKSYYDLYSSESRLTSYYAIMTHQIPADHWKHLARPAKKEFRRLILPGWSGTMFEFFMPHMFLPAYRNTLCGELLKGVLSAQIRYVGKKIPWGISESGYYTFDSALNYQYRAFGVPALALRRDLSFPKIVSPYSTYLAYPWFPSVANENLKRFPRGKYGCYEAIDYRQGDENPRIVQSFMAHHVGMAFLSGVNVLCGHKMQQRFMDTEGEAYVSLLTEGIPTCSFHRFVENVKDRERWQAPEQRIDKPDPDHPRVKFLTNGKISEIISDSGDGYLRRNDCCLTAPPNGMDSENGIYVFVQNKGELHGASYAPLYEDHAQYRMYYDTSGATCYGAFRDFETRLSATLHHDRPIFLRELTIKNNLMTENSFEFFLYLHPILSSQADYEAHPEYKDLFVVSEYDPSRNIVSFKRQEHGKEIWFSVAASREFTFDVRRDSFARFSDISFVKTEGACKYPIFPALVLKGTMNLRGRGSDAVSFAFGVGDSKALSLSGLEAVLSSDFEQLRRRYAQFTDAYCVSAGIHAADRMIFDRISSRILFPQNKSAVIKKAANSLPRTTLWKYGISGDLPIVSLRIGEENTDGILTFLKAARLLLYGGFPVDLIVLFRESSGYYTPLKTALRELISDLPKELCDRVFFLNVHSVDEYLFFQKVSAFFLNLERGWKWTLPHRSFHPIHMLPPVESADKLMLPLGRGGYTKKGSFKIVKTGKDPLRPWSLVLANSRFGTVVHERGLGFTFACNASENRITPRIPSSSYSLGGEHLYAVVKGKYYDLLLSSAVEFFPHGVLYQVTVFDCEISVEVFVPSSLSAKIIQVTMASASSVISEIVYDPKIILGRSQTGTVTRSSEDGVVLFQNSYNDRYGSGVAALFGINVDAEGDSLRFKPSEDRLQAVFVLGYGCGKNSARQLAEILSDPKRIAKEEKKSAKHALPYLKLDSPDRELNCFVNGFLQQQILQSRIYGRTGPSQPGGAFGFRDQLQDSLCLALFDPCFLKHQILRCALHQFEAGDVLHWWHPRLRGEDDGIRSRFSDDPFWLVYACAEYYSITQDTAFFGRQCSYLRGEVLGENEKDRYFTPEKTEYKESVYQHAMRAFRWGDKRGAHGLILFGSGDWNDGMNGVESGGETVWGTMFALFCAKRFLPVAKTVGSEDDVSYLSDCIISFRQALDQYGSNGSCFLRGYRGDGTPFGGEGTVSLIPQAFAVFCDLEGAEKGIKAALSELWDPEKRILRLFSPPYEPREDGFPGSISAYPPGVRENGGQYTHGAIWFARALFLAGKTEAANEIFLALNPVTKNRTLADVRNYGGEPYVMPADVYDLEGRRGFCGWTHYTGAAGWYLKTLSENLLGIRRQGNFVTVTPSLPSSWNGCRVDVSIGKDLLKIRIERGTEIGMYEKGEKISRISLSDSVHEISIIV